MSNVKWDPEEEAILAALMQYQASSRDILHALHCIGGQRTHGQVRQRKVRGVRPRTLRGPTYTDARHTAVLTALARGTRSALAIGLIISECPITAQPPSAPVVMPILPGAAKDIADHAALCARAIARICPWSVPTHNQEARA